MTETDKIEQAKKLMTFARATIKAFMEITDTYSVSVIRHTETQESMSLGDLLSSMEAYIEGAN